MSEEDRRDWAAILLEWDDARAERDRLRVQLAAVAALHPEGGLGYCRGCGYVWPCKTLRAVTVQP